MRSIIIYVFILVTLFTSCGIDFKPLLKVEKWDVYEANFEGPDEGNPFKDVILTAKFTHDSFEKEIKGFYDGDGNYKIRFMPDAVGTWSYVTSSNVSSLNGKSGRFECISPSKGNHGPVRVFNTYHFRYADGTPYKQVGTTCYAWVHQGDSLEEKTLETLSNSPFNKMRMCVFPKAYSFNKNEPVYYPFERDSLGTNDFSRFDPDFWHHFEKRLKDLQELAIEADIILFHPYDRWGYATMADTVDEFYLEYVIARLSAFRHVWWSAANEFDFMHNKTMPDWHRFFEILYKEDPYHRLRSIHNGRKYYDHSLPWITHASIQGTDFVRVSAWLKEFKKPIIFDECRYEGNIRFGWGNLTPQEMTAMFWKSLIKGTYAGHGETYKHPDDILWWSKGGKLHGESPARIAFYKTILDETPEAGLNMINEYAAGVHGEQYIFYFDEKKPKSWQFDLPPNIMYRVEIIDTWNMKRNLLKDKFRGKFKIDLPGEKYIAVRIIKDNLIFPIKKPDYTPRGELFNEEVDVHLIHPYPKSLRYTLDGSIPDLEAQKYVKPIKINRDVNLKVLSFWEGKKSDILEVNFRKTGLKPALNMDPLSPGLKYAIYKGKWEKMPNFTRLEPLKRGTAKRIRLNDIVDKDQDYFGVVYTGYIKVPEDDVYTFYLSSDDGSYLYIDGDRIVENDGVHGIIEKIGQVGLKKGVHAMEVWFFDNWQGHSLVVEIQGQKMRRQKIPSSFLFSNDIN